jgi:hypothetical protein
MSSLYSEVPPLPYGEEFLNFKLSDMSGKNFTLICTDGKVEAHHNVLCLKSELIFTMTKFKPSQELVIDFPVEVVEKCVLAFYDEITGKFDPIMYEVFLFFMARKEYLDLDRYDMSGDTSEAEQFLIAKEESCMMYLRKNSVVLDWTDDVSHEDFSRKLKECLDIPRESRLYVENAIEELEDIIGSRMSTILSSCASKDSYNKDTELCMATAIHMINDSNLPLCYITTSVFRELNYYGIGILPRLANGKLQMPSYSFDGIGRCMVTVGFNTFLVKAELKISEEKSMKLFGYHSKYMMIRIKSGSKTPNLEQIRTLAKEYPWISLTNDINSHMNF